MRRAIGLTLLAAALARPAAAAGEPPVILVVALDTSGSIGAADRARARDLTLALLEALPQGSEAAVLTFDDESRLVVERTTNPAPVREAIMAAQATGRFTALHDALYDASRYLRDAPNARKAIVLLTDGRDENSALNLDDGLAVATGSGIPVLAVGMGRVEERTLRRIAKLTGGDYVALADAGGASLAQLIASLPLPGAAHDATSVAAAAPEAPPSSADLPPNRGWRGALWLLLVGGVLVAGVLLVLGLSRRRPEPASALAAAAASGGPGADALGDSLPQDSEEDGPYSPTVIARMESTEEYLEKTITLSDTPVLVIQGGPQSGAYYALSEKAVTCLGRAKANDVVLDDVSISAQHCRIRYEDGRFVLHDLKSTNGTFVNEQRVSRHALKAGDVVKLGETHLLFKMDRRKA